MKNEFKVILMGSGTNFHRKLPITSMSSKNPCVFKFQNKEYTLKPEHLFLDEKWFDFMMFKWFKKKRFVSIINESTGEIVKLSQQEDISCEDLKTAEESRAASKAMSTLFASVMPGKKIIFFIIIGVVAVVAFLIFTGQIKLGKLI